MKTIGAVIGAVLSGIYLLNMGAGILELIPDNIPVAGNLDELVASLVLLRCLMVLGLDPISLKQLVLRKMPSKETIDIEVEEVKDKPSP